MPMSTSVCYLSGHVKPGTPAFLNRPKPPSTILPQPRRQPSTLWHQTIRSFIDTSVSFRSLFVHLTVSRSSTMSLYSPNPSSKTHADGSEADACPSSLGKRKAEELERPPSRLGFYPSTDYGV